MGMNTSALTLKEISDDKSFTLLSGGIDFGKIFFKQNVNDSVSKFHINRINRWTLKTWLICWLQVKA